MKLRDRLLLFSTAQLLVFGAVFALAYGAFQRSVLPMFESLLSGKAQRIVLMESTNLDDELATGNASEIARTVADVVDDPDFTYMVVCDIRGHIVYSHGEPPPAEDFPPGALFSGPPLAGRINNGHAVTWGKIVYQGRAVGAIAIVFSTERIDAIVDWAQRIVAGVTLIWLAALGYSVVFARSLVRPIRAMMDFSRKVAGGALAERLAIAAPGELRELRDYLNQMTADLERREAERVIAAAHAEDMQSELLTASRLAGMTEIATGVLHNVGNVLNSLNVSVSMISEQVKASRVAGLARSVEMADGFPGGLPAFLSTEKGKILPAYLSSVAKRLTEENERLLEELTSVNKNVDHIKTIVAMQQSYARPSGLKEPVVLAALIDDALHMGEASFARHGIEIVKDYGAPVSVVSDRHKLLQIMINLISNARHALKDQRTALLNQIGPRTTAQPTGPQYLTVRIRASASLISVSVIDTGIGIPAENLDKIFRHGFTTKRGGHGFGLHASANSARELGGNLHASSDGLGRGATFTLELPATADEKAHDLRN